MASVREHLIFKALAALYVVKESSMDAPVRPSWPLRFCLAYLSTQSNGGRAAFDYFWTAMQDTHPTSTDGGRYMRHCNLGRAMSSIAHGLGFNDTPQIANCLRRAASSGAVNEFWQEVQTQLDDGRQMPTPRIKRDKV
jgi:hypothetical protein